MAEIALPLDRSNPFDLLFSQTRPTSYEHGGTIWSPHTRADRIFLLKRGEVSIAVDEPGGKEVIVRTIRPAEIFGVFAIASNGRDVWRSTARAVVTSLVAAMPVQQFVEGLERHPPAFAALMFMLSVRLDEAEGRMSVLARRGAEERLGALLLHLANSAVAEGEDTVVVHLSHEQLAQMAAMSRAHVTVVLGRFREAGLVAYSRNKPLRLNTSRLKSYLDMLADEHYSVIN